MVPALIQPKSLDELSRLGQIFRQSGYFKNVLDEAQAVTKILYGMELGFSPVISMMGIYIVDGKPSLSGNLLGALVKRSGKYNFVVKTMTSSECSIEFFEEGKSIGVSSFTTEDAKLAGLLFKDSWKKYPKAMFYNRALSAGVRAFCPDVSMCPIYVPEEIGAEVTEAGDVISMPDTVSGVAETITLTPVKSPDDPATTATIATEPPQAEVPFLDPIITRNQKQYLAKRFRESLKEEHQPRAEELRHAALTALHQSGIFTSLMVDGDGNPTSEFILASEYDAIGKALVKVAKSV